MSLQNNEYDLIMREYSRRQNESHRSLEARRKTAYAGIPRLSDIDREISSMSAECIRKSLFSGDHPDLSSLRKRTEALERERISLLVSFGYPENYLELQSFCPKCNDTGYLENGERCTCFRHIEIDLLYRQEQLKEVLSSENFDTFSLDWYPDTLIDQGTGRTSKDLALNAWRSAREFTENFDNTFSNLFFYGDTGVGKTFLSHCIAAELLKTSHSVLYFSSFDLFDRIADNTFQEDQKDNSRNVIYECDLLIIDDLGTEFTNSFVSSGLFRCINERLSNRKSTVISTNLSLKDFSEIYSERTFSRIAGAYRMCKLTGKDIRIQKKFNGGN